MPSPQYRYWIATIPSTDWSPPVTLVEPLSYLKGQKEIGAGGFEHWQVLIYCRTKVTRNTLKNLFCQSCHLEPTRSNAAEAYVWKEDTKVVGSEFEVGQKSYKRNSKHDWDRIFNDAKSGNFDDIPKDVLIRNYSSLKRIRVDFMPPVKRPVVKCWWFVGPTGTGKTYTAWQEAGSDVYIKNPLTKWWCGYRQEQNVIIDEFTGKIDVSNLIRWLDPYPCFIEIKGFAQPLHAVNFWITSNMTIEECYKDAFPEHIAALKRRIKVKVFNTLTAPGAPNPNRIRTLTNLTLVPNPINLTQSAPNDNVIVID